MEKTVIIRKDHRCDACGKTIPKGSKTTFVSARGPRHNGDDEQVGIEYYKGHYHFELCID